MKEEAHSALRKQAWDYFSTHASQRNVAFNFYIILSSLVATGYFASFKEDSNLQTARPVLAGALCLFAFVFWKLDQRNKLFVKNAERALKFFEKNDPVDEIAKVFTQEEKETDSKKLKGWRRVRFWEAHLTYSDCFNLLFFSFFLVGLVGLMISLWHYAVWHLSS